VATSAVVDALFPTLPVVNELVVDAFVEDGLVPDVLEVVDVIFVVDAVVVVVHAVTTALNRNRRYK
jgi:hypothetical protein